MLASAMADDRGDFNIAHVAGLARLALTPDEQALYQTQLAGILAFAAQVLAVPTGGVPPMTQADAGAGAARSDEVCPSAPAAEALRHAPDADPNAALFRVPKVLG
jgi:aspartyl-tRNA(Asn)/glutamyl-tRNA(Gln) amidotransferase subunit C